MKYVYVLTSSDSDYYYEQFFLSITSLRLYNQDAEIIVLVDKKTKQNLTGKRSGYEKPASEIQVINVPDEYSQKEASRWIKTSIHHYVSGKFIFIDCDTIITKSLNYDFPANISVGAVLDCHVTLENHHLRNVFQREDVNAGFTSSLKTNIRYNGGLILCRDCPDALDFFEKWHSLWIEGRKKGSSQDMPSLNQANYEKENIITELSGEWNCQISHNGLNFFHNAKIIHYFATTLLTLVHPYKLASADVLSSIKEKGEISPEISELLHNPLAAFEQNTRIISGKYILDVFDSPLFKLLLWLRDYHNSVYKRLNGLIMSLTSALKKNPGYSKRKLRESIG
jgi:hypothetical protein